ncbi:Insulinase (Peptidase M16) [Gracilaria domingensis]|nr:Insulinase (Peptidase M16) [Gracilaria domingensis]
MNKSAESDYVIHPPLEVSPYDQLGYRAITLANDLDVLIASDPSSDKAAASLDVAVGHFSDPHNLPGLAHFLEHMLFLGTKKYPDEDSYNNFLAENGGHSNAYTAQEHTNYYFEMIIADKRNEEADGKMPPLKEALDRFSQFFKAPLFTESATERELNAVHSEHQKNLQSDSRRRFQVQSEMSNPDHPRSKFSTGSLETLRDIPQEEGVDVRAALLDFHRTYYSANIMKLCIIGPHPIDVMQEWVCELFSGISNTGRELPCEAYRSTPPVRKQDCGRKTMVESIKDIRLLEISWTTPWCANEYRSRPGYFIAGYVGYEGEGSVLSLLKKRGWADSLSCGPVPLMTYSEFVVYITLTAEGVEHIDEIISLIYQCIRLVKENGITSTAYEEEAVLKENQFRFREKSEPGDFVLHGSSWMHYLKPTQYLSGQVLYMEFNPEDIRTVLEYLTPENSSVMITGRFVSEKTTMREKWYGTPFCFESIPLETLAKWDSCSCDPKLFLRQSNPFIPSEFDLHGEPLLDGERDRSGPNLVHSTELMDVYHKLDRSFKRPKACILVLVRTPGSYASPLHVVLTYLLSFLVEDALMEYSYPASRAGFEYEVEQQMNGLQIYLKGYNHRIDVLLEAVFRKIASLEVDPIRFAMQKDHLQRSYQNFAKAQPYSRAMYNTCSLLEEPRWHVSECLSALMDDRVTPERMAVYAKEMCKRAHIMALVTGNIAQESAIGMIENVHSILRYTPTKDYEHVTRRVVQLPFTGDVFFRMKHSNPEDNNSAIEVLFQIGLEGHFETDMKLELLSEILNKPCFYELRTVQQLGYMVFEGYREYENTRGLFVIVQSTVKNPDDLLVRIDTFLVSSREKVLECMTDEKFDQFKSALRAKKSQPERSLGQETFRFWNELISETREFDRPFKEIEALESIQKEDVVKFYDEYIAPGGRSRRRIVSQVYGNEHPFEERQKPPENAIDVLDQYAFRRSFPLYPVGGIHNFARE